MKKILSIAITLFLIVGMLGTTVFMASAEETTVAKVGDASFASLKEAIDSVTEGSATVTVVADATVSEVITIGNKNITIEAASPVTITVSIGDAFTVTTGGELTLGANLTINSSTALLYATGGGKIYVDGATLTLNNEANNDAIAFVDNGLIEVNSGYVSKTNNANVTLSAKTENGKIVINGGTVHSELCTAIVAKNGGIVEIAGGKVVTDCADPAFVSAYSISGGKIIMSGGEIESASGASLAPSTNGIIEMTGGTVDSIKARMTGGEITVSGGTVTGELAVGEGNTVTVSGGTFSDLDALYYLSDDAEVTIVLTEDATLEKGVTIAGNVTIKAESEVTVTNSISDALTVNGNLTLGENLTINSSAALLYATEGGYILIDGATLTLDNEANKDAIAFVDNGLIEVKSGYVSKTNNANVTMSAKTENGKILINGGTVHSELCTAIVAKNGGIVEITDGKVITDCEDPAFVSVYSISGGKIIMSGGEIESASGVSLAPSTNGIVEMTGGTVESIKARMNGGEITISGGTITGDLVVGEGNTATVTGGTFSSDVSDYLAEGYIQNADGSVKANYEITVSEDVENGTVKVNVETANEGHTITVTATPKTGYSLVEIVVTDANGNPVDVVDGKFTMPASDVTVSATFAKIPTYKVSVSKVGKGSVSTAKSEYAAGESVTLNVAPGKLHKVESLTVVDKYGWPVVLDGYTFTMPAGGVTVKVTFIEVLPMPATVNFAASVALEGGEIAAGDCALELSYDINGKNVVIQTLKNDAEGNVKFAPVSFYGPCTYTFYIKQVAGEAASVEYDAAVYAITVKVTYDASGELVAAVSAYDAVFCNAIAE